MGQVDRHHHADDLVEGAELLVAHLLRPVGFVGEIGQDGQLFVTGLARELREVALEKAGLGHVNRPRMCHVIGEVDEARAEHHAAHLVRARINDRRPRRRSKVEIHEDRIGWKQRTMLLVHHALDVHAQTQDGGKAGRIFWNGRHDDSGLRSYPAGNRPEAGQQHHGEEFF